MDSTITKRTLNIEKLFTHEYPFAFKLLIVLLVFNSFRPDRLIPGGQFLVYFPTAVLLLLMLLLLKNPNKIFQNLQTKLLLLFSILMVFQVPFARNSYWSFMYLRSFLLYTLTSYVAVIIYLDTGFKVDKYARLFVITSVFLAVLGIAGQGVVAVPILSDENDFCLLMNFLIPFGFFLGQEADTKRKKIFYYSLVFVFVLSNLRSFSRGGFVGLAVTGLFLFYKSKHKIASLIIILLMVLGMYFVAPSGYREEIRTIRTEGVQAGTGKERIESWKAGWRMFLNHPIIGVGSVNYGMWVQDYYVQYGSKAPENMWGRVAHSLYFTLLPEMGIVGTLIFIGMLWGNYRDHRYIANLNRRVDHLLIKSDMTEDKIDVLKMGIRKLYFLSLAYSGAMIAYLTTGIFLSVLWYGYFWMLTSFWVATSNVAKKIENVLLEGGVSSSGNG